MLFPENIKSCSPPVPVVDPLVLVHPEPGQLGENIDNLESLEVVDEDVGHPETVDQLKVHCNVRKS